MQEIETLTKLLGIGIGSLLIIFLGQADKKGKLTNLSRLIFQTLIALLVIYCGVRIEFLRNPSSSGDYIYLHYLSLPLTLIWIVSITNSISQVDILGDITPNIVLIAALTFLLVALFQKQGLILAEGLSLFLVIFSLIGIKFWSKEKFSNFYMFFGFLLAVIAIVGVSKSTAALTLLIPLLILGVPILDSSFSIVATYTRIEDLKDYPFPLESRLRQKLQSYGFSRQGANFIIISFSIYLSLVALIISVYENIYLLISLLAGGVIIFELIKRGVQNQEVIIEEDSLTHRIKLFQVGIDRIDNQMVVKKLKEFLSSPRQRPYVVVTPDTLAILRARQDVEYSQILKSADLVTPDGAGILWATSTLQKPLMERVTGIDMINKLCTLAIEKGFTLYLLGASPGIAKEAAQNLINRFPGLKIVGTHHGYFRSKIDGNSDSLSSYSPEKNQNQPQEKEEKDIIREINQKHPDILLVGMGAPRQEKWIASHSSNLKVGLCMGVGGSFDVISGRIPRAPLWMQEHGMEWIYRLIKQPQRIIRVFKLFYFIGLVLVNKGIIGLQDQERKKVVTINN